MQAANTGGSSGYAGYEYQKGVTTWLSLELMIAKAVADSIVVEPRSQEDIEAALKEPDEASLEFSTAPNKLTVQIKSRSTAPWTSSAFADVLKGEADDGKLVRRARPLEMLASDPRVEYLFVTNESVDASLRPHLASTVLEFPDPKQMPPYARDGIDGATQASMASRLAILSGITLEVLESRLGRLLELHCHIPASNHPECIRDLKEAISERMLGGHGGLFRKGELLELLAEHGGSVLPTRSMDHYVPPKSYQRIDRCLAKKHAVIISGPSGTGKTLTADILELKYHRSNPPYEIVGGENGPGPIRSRLSDPRPVIFHLRDPWGSNRITPAAEPWANELPKLLTQANPSHKFLVTSRSDVLQSAGAQLEKRLAPYVVQIEIEDYGYDLLAKIYDGISSDLRGPAAELARRHRSAALKELKRPYELDRFLVALTQEDYDKPRPVDAILKSSQIDAISSVVADQVQSHGSDGVAAGAIIWAMLHAREVLTTEVLQKIALLLRGVDPNLRPDLDGMVDFLVAGRNLRRAGDLITFYHPRVDDGLRMAIETRKNETAYVLSCLVGCLATADNALQDWAIETGLNVLESTSDLEGISISISQEAHTALGELLENRLVSSREISTVSRGFRLLADYGSASHVPSKIARILLDGSKLRKQEDWSFGESWKAPQIDAMTLEDIAKFPRTTTLLSFFVRDVLPFSRTHYPETLVPLLYSLAPVLNLDFRKGVEVIADPGGPIDNIEAVVVGACYGSQADFDWVIQQFVTCEEKAEAWWKKFEPKYHKAEEHVFDAAYTDHIFEEPDEQFYNSREGLQIAGALRLRKEGVSWLANHEHRELLARRIADYLHESSEPVSPDQLRVLLEFTNGEGHNSVWRAIDKHWNDDLQDVLDADLSRPNADESLRQTLISVASRSSKGLQNTISDLLPKMPRARRLEVLCDMVVTSVEQEGEDESRKSSRVARAKDVASRLTGDEAELALAMIEGLEGAQLQQVADRLSSGALNELQSRLADTAGTTLRVLAWLASGAALDLRVAVDRLLHTEEIDEGLAAVQCLAVQRSVDQLLNAWNHQRFAVRCEALKLLVGLLGENERKILLKSAEDPSADVRLTWAELMGEVTWPEAIPMLTKLVSDKRNFNSDSGIIQGPGWSEFRVARAAARALQNFEELPASTLDVLISAATISNDDPFVRCACLAALATKDDPRITDTLFRSLAVEGLRRARQYSPVAQAAAWALFDRASSNKLDADAVDLTLSAVHQRPSIAAPALLANACMGIPRIQIVLAKVNTETFVYRSELLRAAAATLRGGLLEGATEIDRSLAALAAGSSLQELGEDGAKLLEWSKSLRVDRDVQGYTAWLVSAKFGLPTTETIENPREFDLPERIGTFTTRSLTPYRERQGLTPDDGT